MLQGLMAALEPARLHFGWRVLDEVVGFLERAREHEVLPFGEALDHAIYAKVLPKLRGDDTARFRDALDGCRTLLRDERLVEFLAKVEDLTAALESTGSARFYEPRSVPRSPAHPPGRRERARRSRGHSRRCPRGRTPPR